jgi:protein-L-isoaspartate(D-aspartate) O-methyltransferase
MKRRFGYAFWAAGAAVALAADPYLALREKMVRQDIAERGIRNRAVLNAMRSTPRHLFVPENVRDAAYNDHPLPIGNGQTISQPYIVAYMTELLDPKPSQKALEVGTGSGYQAAVLSPLVKDVYSVEIVPELARRSADLLQQLGYANVHVREADGYKGWPGQAPFDRIILTAAPPRIPQALIDQLSPGGRLVAPVGDGPLSQELVVIDKGKDGKVTRRRDLPVRFVPMVPK